MHFLDFLKSKSDNGVFILLNYLKGDEFLMKNQIIYQHGTPRENHSKSHFKVPNWSNPNEFLILSYESSIQSTRIPRIFPCNSLWIMKYFKFCNENFVDFLISYRFYTIKASDFLHKMLLVFQKAERCCWVFGIYWKLTPFGGPCWQI